MSIAARLAEVGLQLPPTPAPIANYVPAVLSGAQLVISGQLCLGADGKIAERHKGKVGGTVKPEDAVEAARFAALNVIAQAEHALGDLDRVVRCVRLGGFINVTPDFIAMPQVMNGASDLMVTVFGEAGRHARSTIGVASLPLDASVEVEALFEVKG
jgi:enamine deaminase RidA (YjgF/YER057c/UK114 family)